MKKKELLKQIDELQKEIEKKDRQYDERFNYIISANKRLNERYWQVVKEYNELFDNRHDCIEFWHKKYQEKVKSYNKLLDKITFNKVISNKGTTVVWFDDKEKVVVKLAKGDKGDVYSAVAYAIVKRLYDNNSHFKKKVNEVLKDK